MCFSDSVSEIMSLDIDSGDLLWQTPTQSNTIYEENFFIKTSDLIADNSSRNTKACIPLNYTDSH